MLTINEVTINFGGLTAVDDVSLKVKKGSITALIGPNGAGKTTLFNIIGGVYKPSHGDVVFCDRHITGLKPYQVKSCGMSRTYQQINLFAHMTVLENVLVGAHTVGSSGLFSSILRLKRERTEEKRLFERARKELEFVKLWEKADLQSSNLPYGEQRLLEIARALVSAPKLILLDEPAAGMNTKEKMDLMQLVYRIRERAVTVLLVEHDMKFVMGLADEIHVMNFGKKIAEGTPKQIQKHQVVIDAYLGVDYT